MNRGEALRLAQELSRPAGLQMRHPEPRRANQGFGCGQAAQPGEVSHGRVTDCLQHLPSFGPMTISRERERQGEMPSLFAMLEPL